MSTALTMLGTPFITRQFFGNDGLPLSGGLIEFFVAGSDQHQNTWQNSSLASLNANPVQLDAYGRANIFTDPSLTYDVTISTSAGVQIDAIEGYQVPAGVIYGIFGQTLSTGSRNVAPGYQVLITDTLVTIVGTAPASVINLDDARVRTKPLCIKNASGYTILVVGMGGQTIDFFANYTMAAASGPNSYPSLWLMPDATNLAVGSWLIIGSH